MSRIVGNAMGQHAQEGGRTCLQHYCNLTVGAVSGLPLEDQGTAGRSAWRGGGEVVCYAMIGSISTKHLIAKRHTETGRHRALTIQS